MESALVEHYLRYSGLQYLGLVRCFEDGVSTLQEHLRRRDGVVDGAFILILSDAHWELLAYLFPRHRINDALVVVFHLDSASWQQSQTCGLYCIYFGSILSVPGGNATAERLQDQLILSSADATSRAELDLMLVDALSELFQDWH